MEVIWNFFLGQFVKEQSISFKYTENCFNGPKVDPPFYESRVKHKTDIIVKIEEHKALIFFLC